MSTPSERASVSYPLFKFLHPVHAKSMLELGEVRVGTLHEYRNRERYDQHTYDEHEGNLKLVVRGPRHLDAHELRRLGIDRSEPLVVGHQDTHVLSIDWPDCNVYCTSRAFFTSTLAQSIADHKTACVAIMRPQPFFSSLAAALPELSLEAIAPCHYHERTIKLAADRSLQGLGPISCPPVLIKPISYADQREVRAVWSPTGGAASHRIVRMPDVTQHLLPVDFDAVDIPAVLERTEGLQIGVRLDYTDGSQGLFSTQVPGEVFTMVGADIKGIEYLAFTPETQGNTFVGTRMENLSLGFHFHPKARLVGGAPLAKIRRLRYFSERLA